MRKLTHPTGNNQVAWWVRCAALRLPTLEWGAGFCKILGEAHPP
ncbi:hypothetical protein BN132_3122 [Cronobacter turicensis 564]|nr:hypothetical protein BN132_3122 [Cronobacter turicensis 564]